MHEIFYDDFKILQTKKLVSNLHITVFPLLEGHSHQRWPLLSGQISDEMRVKYH